MLVRERMSTDPVTLSPDDTLREARRLIRELGLRRFPVVEEGRLVGIVTDRDVRQADMSSAVVQERRYVEYILDRIQVRGIMTPDPITVTPDTPLEEAARLILDNKIGGLPVVEGGRLVGIITETDLIRTLVEMLESGRTS
ncbi:CBS domain-containing protein [Candidatus Solincola tengchongensis]|uniref:CBS domain-containing protein n=1 Tax=Candidatus Solincola tengchongensis TaxID=2900693 RepID=UPI00257C620B|nr:CBS domain-containing protein [Candidatus Solincola tengchongensis]